MFPKITVSDLAIFGGNKLFNDSKSTSNLVRPNLTDFLKYSKRGFRQDEFTNANAIVNILEQRLASLHQAKFCVTFCSGFWALVLAVKALALAGKDEIIMPSLTYRRMADIASWTRLKPHFCEVEEATLAMSADTVRPCVNENTSLILGVHPIVN